jgi:hypothetical protein
MSPLLYSSIGVLIGMIVMFAIDAITSRRRGKR